MSLQTNVQHHFEGCEDSEKDLFRELVQRNIEIKMDSYFKKVVAHYPDSRLDIIVGIHKDKTGKFEGVFRLLLGKEQFVYDRSNGEGFINPEDLVNHAFDKAQRFIAEHFTS